MNGTPPVVLDLVLFAVMILGYGVAAGGRLGGPLPLAVRQRLAAPIKSNLSNVGHKLVLPWLFIIPLLLISGFKQMTWSEWAIKWLIDVLIIASAFRYRLRSRTIHHHPK